MKTMKKIGLLTILAIIIGMIGMAFISCFESDLDKTIKAAVGDGKITKIEAQKIHQAFDNDGKYALLDERIKYVSDLAPDMKDEDIRKALEILKVHPKDKSVFVYLDNTESMRGYMNATDAGKFACVLTAINDYYSKDNITPQAFYTEATSQNGNKVTQVVPIDFSKLRSDLTAHQMNKYSDSYQLNDFFDVVTKRLMKDSTISSICFFVTDGIPSGTNEEISRSPQRRFSISQKEDLQSRIADVIRPLGQKGGFGAAVFQFFAPYKGDYWKYNNDHGTRLNDHERPFYVFAIGQKDMLKDFVEQVEDGLNSFVPQKSVVFLEGAEPFIPRNPDYLEKKEGGKGDEFKFNAEEVNEDAGKEETSATLYFKLDALPYYLRDTSVLKEKVRIEVEGVDIGQDRIEVKADRINFKVKAKEQATQKVHVVVEDFLPSWVGISSSPDDIALSPNNPNELKKTFNFDILVRGIEQGIFNKGGERNAIDKVFILDSNENEDD